MKGLKRVITRKPFDYIVNLPIGCNRCIASRVLKAQYSNVYIIFEICIKADILKINKANKIYLTEKGKQIQRLFLILNEQLQ